MSVNDHMDGLIAKVKTSCDRSLTFAIGGSGPDLADYFWRKFFGISPSRDGMGDVCPMCGPLQVGPYIVRSIKIFMVNVRQMLRVGDKSLSDQSGDKKGLLFAILAKRQLPISTAVKSPNNNLSALYSYVVSVLVADWTIYSSYSSKIGNFIKAFVTSDRKPSLAYHSFLHCCLPYTTWQTMKQG